MMIQSLVASFRIEGIVIEPEEAQVIVQKLIRQGIIPVVYLS
jgi:hypothetical protein